MKTFKIRSRLEFFLAKVAGRNIDVDTLVPPVATNAAEELLLEIADKISDAGKSTPAATTTAAGVVKQVVNVDVAAGTAPTKAEFDALIGAMIAAGVMAPPSTNS